MRARDIVICHWWGAGCCSPVNEPLAYQTPHPHNHCPAQSVSNTCTACCCVEYVNNMRGMLFH